MRVITCRALMISLTRDLYSNGEMATYNYDKGVYSSLTQSEQEEVLSPKRIDDVYELKRIWSLLHKLKVKDELFDRWVEYLPTGYERVMDDKVLEYMWYIESNVVPLSMKADYERIATYYSVGKMVLYTLFIYRQRMNELGFESVCDYIKAHQSIVTQNWIHTDDDDVEFFKLETVKCDNPHFRYIQEISHLRKLTLLKTDRYASDNDSNDPESLRHTLWKWTGGTWHTYRKENKTLLSYAASLIRYFCHQQNVSLNNLPCYSIHSLHWSPGCITVPNELREAVDSVILHLSDSPNSTFLRNYYNVASQHILRIIDDDLSRTELKRRRDIHEDRCIIQ